MRLAIASRNTCNVTCLELPVIELPSRAVVLSVIALGADAGLSQLLLAGLTEVVKLVLRLRR